MKAGLSAPSTFRTRSSFGGAVSCGRRAARRLRPCCRPGTCLRLRRLAAMRSRPALMTCQLQCKGPESLNS
eukprot:7160018-Alexandrium_andersonii.AAC.1